MNDTGITAKKADYDDSQYGRDVTDNNDADGHAGFSFSSENGCIRDNVTGLLWSPTIQDQDVAITMDFVTAESQKTNANNTALCKQNSGWRIPTVTELLSLVSYDRTETAIDTNFFQDTQASYYWTSVNGPVTGNKWGVTFSGSSLSVKKDLNTDSYLRLVNGPELKGAFTIDANGDVYDEYTSLIWKRCFATYEWNNTTKQCESSGAAANAAYVWKDSSSSTSDALDLTDPVNGWRLPNLKELQSITGESLFPLPETYSPVLNATGTYAWSSSPYAGNSALIWMVDAATGEFAKLNGTTKAGVVRLVKAAPAP